MNEGFLASDGHVFLLHSITVRSIRQFLWGSNLRPGAKTCLDTTLYMSPHVATISFGIFFHMGSWPGFLVSGNFCQILVSRLCSLRNTC